MKQADDKHSCIQPICEEGFKVTKEATCKKCELFTSPSDDKRSCEPPKCEDNEFYTEGGICKTCPEYERRDEYGISCANMCTDL